jgi:hypothetical protein
MEMGSAKQIEIYCAYESFLSISRGRSLKHIFTLFQPPPDYASFSLRAFKIFSGVIGNSLI